MADERVETVPKGERRPGQEPRVLVGVSGPPIWVCKGCAQARWNRAMARAMDR